MGGRKRRKIVFRIWREVISFGRLFIYINWKISRSRCRQQIQILLSTYIRKRGKKLWLNSLLDFKVCILLREYVSLFHNETSPANKIECTKRHPCVVSWRALGFGDFFGTRDICLNFFLSFFLVFQFLNYHCSVLSSQNFLQLRK